jgi:transposase-like protein
LEEIWMAETKRDALAAFDAFVEIYDIKYEKAVECLTKDRDALLAVYDFRQSIGSICAHRTRSKALSRPCAPGRYTRRGVYRTKPLSP